MDFRDDHERENIGFDWRNTPDSKHPGGNDCRCPRHEWVREKIDDAKHSCDAGHPMFPTLKLCPPHYKYFFGEQLHRLSLFERLVWRIILKLGLLKVRELSHMGSGLCDMCKIGGGGGGIKTPKITV